MTEGALRLYKSLDRYYKIQDLIDAGETEGLFLECKAPSTPKIDKGLKKKLATAISGFSNTAGGVILWGVSTTSKEHSGLDVLTQIEAIGNVRNFLRQIEAASPILTTPTITRTQNKVLTRRKEDTRGIILTYIPQTSSDPVRSNQDNHFYFRSDDQFCIAPYEMLRRLFSATAGPDIRPIFDKKIVKKLANGAWKIPFILENSSSAVAEHVNVTVTIDNGDVCEEIKAVGFQDQSEVNPGERVFSIMPGRVLHRGFRLIIGELIVKMNSGKWALRITIKLFANHMKAMEFGMTIQLKKDAFSVRQTREKPLY